MSNVATFLESVAGAMPDQSRPLRLGTIDPAYVAGSFPGTLPRVTFDGEGTLSTRTFVCLSPYWPAPSDRVLLAPVGNTYVITGSVSSSRAGEAFFDPAVGPDLSTGASFGGTVEVAGDALVDGAGIFSGNVTAGARGMQLKEVQIGVTNISFTTSLTFSQAVVFPVAWPAGTQVIVIPNIHSSASNTHQYTVRAISTTVTGFTLYVVISDSARAAQTWSAVPVTWAAFATPA